MTYQLLVDYYLILVDSIWESTKTKSGIITSNTAIHSSNEETTESGEHKRRYGRIIQCPVSFSDAQVDMIDPGLPQSRTYIGHEWLQFQNRRGQRGYRDHENPRKKYYPSTFEKYDVITCEDYAKHVNVKNGDLIYFDPKATDMERYLGPFNGQHMFSVRVDEILCVVKKSPVFVNHERYVRSTILPQGRWVFVELNFESWEDITLPSGIVMKVAPEAIPLQGRVIAAQNKALERKNVLFERDADAPVTIDGKDLTCMRYDDILATLKD